MGIKVIKRDGFPILPSMAAITIGTWVFMRPSATPDVLPHEKVHVKQFRKQPFTFWLRYLFSRNARLHYEAEAYAESINNGLALTTAIQYLVSAYYLDIDVATAKAALLHYIRKGEADGAAG